MLWASQAVTDCPSDAGSAELIGKRTWRIGYTPNLTKLRVVAPELDDPTTFARRHLLDLIAMGGGICRSRFLTGLSSMRRITGRWRSSTNVWPVSNAAMASPRGQRVPATRGSTVS